MFSATQELWSDSSSHVEGWLYDPIILAFVKRLHQGKYGPQASLSSIAIPFLCPFTICYLAVFIYSDYKNIFLPSILHFYHHLFAELVHLYNLPLYWVCWGHNGLFVIWLQGCLRETSLILHLPRIDKHQVIHLKLLLS